MVRTNKSIAIAVLVGVAVAFVVDLLKGQTARRPNVGTTTIEPLENVGPVEGPGTCPVGKVWAPLNGICIPVASPLPPRGAGSADDPTIESGFHRDTSTQLLVA